LGCRGSADDDFRLTGNKKLLMEKRLLIGLWIVVGAGAVGIGLLVAARYRAQETGPPAADLAAPAATTSRDGTAKNGSRGSAADAGSAPAGTVMIQVGPESVKAQTFGHPAGIAGGPGSAATVSAAGPAFAGGSAAFAGRTDRGASSSYAAGGYRGSYAGGSYAGSYAGGSYAGRNVGGGSFAGKGSIPYDVASGRIRAGSGNAYPRPTAGSAGSYSAGSYSGGSYSGSAAGAPAAAGWTGYPPDPRNARLTDLEARAAALEKKVERLVPLVEQALKDK
jgi:hypothetical protein